MNKLLEARNVSRFFDDGNSEVKAVNNVSLSIDKNEKIVEWFDISGTSGAFVMDDVSSQPNRVTNTSKDWLNFNGNSYLETKNTIQN